MSTAAHLAAWAHFTLAFLVVAALAVELTLLRPGITTGEVRALGSVDLAYGAFFTLLVAAGIGRILTGGIGAGYYLTNAWFWAKMGALGVVLALSLPPTFRIVAWGRAARAAASVPDVAAIRRTRRWMYAEAAVLSTVPLTAVLMSHV